MFNADVYNISTSSREIENGKDSMACDGGYFGAKMDSTAPRVLETTGRVGRTRRG